MSQDLDRVAELFDDKDLVLIEHGITIVSYIDSDGDRAIGFKTHGGPWMGETLGLIELAKVMIARRMLAR